MKRHTIKESGKNGTVHFEGLVLVRTIRKTLGRDDVQTIPLRSISSTHLNRRTLGADIVTITVGPLSYEWKSSTADEIAAHIKNHA